MLDFLKISTRSRRKGVTEVLPTFTIYGASKDLMTRGGDFYAIWDEKKHLWSIKEYDALRLIDEELDDFSKEYEKNTEDTVITLHIRNTDTGMIDKWHKYVRQQLRDNYHVLDEKIIFNNQNVKKEDYASHVLPYPLTDGPIDSYNELMSTLYSPEERQKIEWAIGAVISGDSKHIQKFVVLYGSAGTGKSTVLNIIQMLFDGYFTVFDAKALGQANSSFALEPFSSNPLVAIQHDGDLSHIEDNTRLNSLVSHEIMVVNEKFKSKYAMKFNTFLFMGTNKPVKITDAKSGIIRRLIDVSPTGNKLPLRKYSKLMKQIAFELGAIAKHCLDIYKENPNAYDSYVPTGMMSASNDFYNFIEDSYFTLSDQKNISLKAAWEMYKSYCEDARVPYPYSLRVFKEELKNYYKEFYERYTLDDGTRTRNYYVGFNVDKYEKKEEKDIPTPTIWPLIDMSFTESKFDKLAAEYPAQYANDKGTPLKKWKDVSTKLKDLDTTKLHYVKVPENHIVIDFDLKDETGEKSYEENLKAASLWPATYAELSKSGKGIHLHYIYDGDVNELSRVYSPGIEVKVFQGDQSLRRMLTKCNNLDISVISSGLPKKEVKVLDRKVVENERHLMALIKKALKKQIPDIPYTKPSIDFIKKVLDEAYEQGIHYDVSSMIDQIINFAANSTHNADYCLEQVGKMKLQSDDISKPINEKHPLAVFDVEVYVNLFVLCFKVLGIEGPVTKLVNPDPEKVQYVCENYNLIGFNNKSYDNNILYAKGYLMYSNDQLYKLSRSIIDGGTKNYGFREAKNISYTDIYEFSSKKQSLKKWEIEMSLASEEKQKKFFEKYGVKIGPSIHHLEMDIPWDHEVPEERFKDVADYCANDVLATEALFYYLEPDFKAREMLASLADSDINESTNNLTAKIIFGNEKNPQKFFNYRNMGEIPEGEKPDKLPDDLDVDTDFTVFVDGKPIFPGYKYENGVSTYRGEEVGEGGYVYAEPGMYSNVWTFDVASMHPSSIIAENLFGKFTKNFEEIKQARIFIKHGDFDSARKMLDGKLAKYLDDPGSAKSVAFALKIAINAVYGQTKASYNCRFRDPRNVDNIVAKRGALFMINLKHEVQNKGYKVVHIKTDSIKIENPDDYIYDFVIKYGKLYGYNFEIEHKFEKICLVNNAVYIAKTSKDDEDLPGKWTATGAQFAVPYVFKTLFSKEPIDISDYGETKSVTSTMYLDMNEDLKKDEHNYKFIGKVGRFTPMKKFGGELLRVAKDKKTGENSYSAVVGTKGYRWLESDTVQKLGLEQYIDDGYYTKQVDQAVQDISKFGDFEWFTSDN